jgi:hypothetical protein
MSALLELLKNKKQDLAAGKRQKTVKPADGRSRWRILPSWRGAGQQFWHDFGQHFVKKPDNSIAAIYICTDKTFGKPCPICDAVSSGIKSATDDATMKLLKDAKSNGRVLVNAMHLDGKEPGKVEILELPPTLFAAIIDIAQEWEEAGETIFGAGNEGKDIIIQREGTGMNTKYTAQIAAKSQVVPADVLTKLHDLDAYVQQESHEQQLRALNSVRAVTGLLPAPATSAPSGAMPAAAAAAASIATELDDPYAVATPPSKPAAAVKPAGTVKKLDDEITDVPDLPAKATVAATTAPAAAAVESTGDADLDDLLNQLG